MKHIILLIICFFFIENSRSEVVCDDCDNDGINDNLEQTLAEKFAPIIYHDPSENNYPTNVDTFLQHTKLYIYDDECDFPKKDIHKFIKENPTQQDLIMQQFDDNFCGSTGLVKSNCTRSIKKQRTYYLQDVDSGFKAGSSNTKEWITYFHAYKNINSGITVQYWRFYSFNTGFKKYNLDFSHGGDWESVQVVLDSTLNPVAVDLLGHTDIERINWSTIKSDNNHPLIFSERGGHTSTIYTNQGGTKQESWSNGKIYRPDGNSSETGFLLNVGEKIQPLNGQYFIQYSGIWGSPGDFYFTSGYWSPSYNETGMNSNNYFIKAWCNEMLNSENKEEEGIKECYPCGTSR